MIDKSFGTFNLICDICGDSADEPFYDFHDAVAYKKANGWKARKEDGEWIDVCPERQED